MKATEYQKQKMKEYYNRRKDYFKEKSEKWLEENRERSNKNMRIWKTKNKEKVNKSKRKDNYQNMIRKRTTRKYGKLRIGYCYHHTTKPYKEDRFMILEKDLHKHYHANPNKFNMRGRI